MKLHAENKELRCNRIAKATTNDWKLVTCIYCINKKLTKESKGYNSDSDTMDNFYAQFWVRRYVQEYNAEGNHFNKVTMKQALIRWIIGDIKCDGNCLHARFGSGCSFENHAGIGQAIDDCDTGIF